MNNYQKLRHQLVGKSSTAEIMHKSDITSSKAEKYKHIWFAGFSLEKNSNKPEIVIIIYLQFADFGKESAPLAAEIVHKYRELKEKYSSSN